MKIKAVRKNRHYKGQDYITLDKVYEVYNRSDDHAEFYDDDCETRCSRLKGGMHGFDFEVVQEDTKETSPDPMPVVEPEDYSLDYQIKSDGGPSSTRISLVTTLNICCESFDEVVINGKRYVLDE